jgi:hypothetical protein
MIVGTSGTKVTTKTRFFGKMEVDKIAKGILSILIEGQGLEESEEIPGAWREARDNGGQGKGRTLLNLFNGRRYDYIHSNQQYPH